MKTISASAFLDLTQKTARRVRSAMRKYHVPGAAVGLIAGDQTWTAGFGVTNLENPLPVDEYTLFQIGSITKTVTAMMAMHLVEAGQLELDAPVRKYLPDLRLADEDTAASVTVRHLFQHTAGWLGDYFADTGSGDDALERVVEKMIALPQETPLGSVWSYNNAAFFLAARVLEVISGRAYEPLVQEKVLEPLGMSRACFFAHDAITYRTAVGHSAVFEMEKYPEVLRPWGMGRCVNAVGGLNLHIIDLMKYARFQMGDGCNGEGKRILSRESLVELHTPSVPGANGEYTGLAWFIREAHGYRDHIRLIRHGGATNGQMANLIIAPQEQVALCILTNSNRGGELIVPLVRWQLEQLLEIPGRLPRVKRMSAGKVKEAAGRYTAAANDIVLRVENGVLWQDVINKGGFPTPDSPPDPNPPSVRLAFTAADKVMIIDEPGKGNLGEFLRAHDGSIEFFRIGGRVHRRS